MTSRPDGLVSLTRSAIQQIAADISERGYGMVADAFSPDQIAEARRKAEMAVQANGRESIVFTGPYASGGEILHDLHEDASFKALCAELFKILYHADPPSISFYQVFRCLTGNSSAEHSLYFHYDSYAITALIPIAIPATGKTGDLVMLPNVRPVRKSYLISAFEKFLLDRRPSQGLIRLAVDRWITPVRIKLVPGNLYFFMGYRSLHANERCDEEALRATVLLHCINPDKGHWLKKRIRPLHA